ncbi:MAG: putative transcriptional regulatory protein pdtaR [candidate division BRC1 bacterium ADurb.BinA364]|nr:MAG: putative transcriptional regulatory protein pdtaR [candidate division BRC1 bacterium ADurb.BinA364]
MAAGIRVVLAEDDFLVKQEIERLLERAGMEIAGSAANGLDALAMVEREQPDAVLLDIRMPKMDGLETARRIREIRPTPVVILTAHETRDLVDEARDAGVGAYLAKPPDEGALQRAIAIAIARHADLMELDRLCKELAKKNAELEQALAEVKTLRGIIPICARCKKIRDDQGFWRQVETYIAQHSAAQFSHGLCPDCYNKEMSLYLKSKPS